MDYFSQIHLCQGLLPQLSGFENFFLCSWKELSLTLMTLPAVHLPPLFPLSPSRFSCLATAVADIPLDNCQTM